MFKQHRAFFEGKNCDICKAQATTIRFMRNRSFVICDNKECDKATRMAVGMFGDLLTKEFKI